MGLCKKRDRSARGIYHVMNRGVNKQPIFFDNYDRCKFLKLLKKIKNKIDFEILSYCLMDNHYHILIKDDKHRIDKILHYIGTLYTRYINVKYGRVGHLFQGKFISKAVNTNESVKRVVRYIHLNPLKAGYVNKIVEYSWSSYYEYYVKENLCNIKLVCDFFRVQDKFSTKMFEEYHEQENLICDDEFYNFEDLDTLQKLTKYAQEFLGNIEISEIVNMKKSIRDLCINKLRKSGLSLKEIQSITNIKYNIISKI